MELLKKIKARNPLRHNGLRDALGNTILKGNITIVFLKFEVKDEDLQMIAITKAEKDAIRARFPNVNIVRTMKQKSKRHHYYCEETKQVARLLKQMRESDCVTNPARRDVRDADRTDGKRIKT